MFPCRFTDVDPSAYLAVLGADRTSRNPIAERTPNPLVARVHAAPWMAPGRGLEVAGLVLRAAGFTVADAAITTGTRCEPSFGAASCAPTVAMLVGGASGVAAGLALFVVGATARDRAVGARVTFERAAYAIVSGARVAWSPTGPAVGWRF